jgi:hypothetical protein
LTWLHYSVLSYVLAIYPPITHSTVDVLTAAAVALGATPKIPRKIPGGKISGCNAFVVDTYAFTYFVGVDPPESIVMRFVAVSPDETVMFVM